MKRKTMKYNPVFLVDVKWVIPLFKLVREEMVKEWKKLPLFSRKRRREEFIERVFKKLNHAFKKYRVQFVERRIDDPDATYQIWRNWVSIFLKEKEVEAFFRWRYEFFTSTLEKILTKLRTSIAHELIHREQHVTAKWKEHQGKTLEGEEYQGSKLIARKPDMRMWEKEDWKIYLSDISEIMAYAHDTVQTLLFKGWSEKKVIKAAKTSRWPRGTRKEMWPLSIYFEIFQGKGPVWAIFMAYIIEYAEREVESGREETGESN